MGQQNSQLVDPSTPPLTLSERSLEAVAKLINDGRVKRIVVLTGAGISTAAGIPDFRSPGTGLYNNLARLNLPHPEAVFELDFFEENPYPFYALAKELYPGNFQPTVSHAFVALLARKRLLRKLFTQNIDCLERAAGVPPDLIIEAHGSFASQRCVDCKVPFLDDEAMRAHVARGEPPLCPREGCTTGIIKPDIVFFGEQLPAAFFAEHDVPSEADLLLVLGTSLSVQPFARLPMLVQDAVPRVLFNLQRVGDLGTRPDDVLCLGDCDAGVRRLADALGWRDELERLWEDTVGAEEAQRQRKRSQSADTGPGADILDDEVHEISEAVEHRLKLDPTSPPFTPASTASVSVTVPGQDRVTQEATAFTNDQRGQGGETKETVVGGENHGGDSRQAHAPDAPARAADGATPGAAEAGAAEGGGGGAGGGAEAEDQRAQEDAEASTTTTAPGETGQQRREDEETETETEQAMPSDALASSPSTSTAPAPPAAEQKQPESPPPKKKKVMIAMDSPEVIEPPPLPAADETDTDTEAEAEVSLPSPPLLPHVVPGDAVAPAAAANAAATSSQEGAAQPLDTLPALKDPPREKVYGEIVGGDGDGDEPVKP
ncbi:NAD-dependent protein deacetylase sirtuin-2 [Diatrype stigma]|uniref:NAD-dependent protein deacetylase sirtuin-2 n=1 Tax=Diatrype stigma TaxID=117547 RepID=A0AAN9U4Z7_9PEZI